MSPSEAHLRRTMGARWLAAHPMTVGIAIGEPGTQRTFPAHDELVKKYVQLCPGKALSMEIICFGPRIFKVQEAQFWEAYQRMPAWEYSRFIRYADRAAPLTPYVNPAKEQVAAAQRDDLAVSAAYTRGVLNAG